MSTNVRRTASLAGRIFNGGCYVVSGIIIFALGASTVWLILIALAMLGYGLYVLFTRGSYWVSTLTYLLPLIGIGLAVGGR